MSRRAEISEGEIAKVKALLQSMGVRIATVDIEPGHVRITTTDAEDLVLPDHLGELERAKENWGTHGRKRNAA